ncbi:excinuclease ABC subunit A [Beggiatoa sp. SS]|nr:excinuclease ABC subunit A [Beggiatoa sp. SS]
MLESLQKQGFIRALIDGEIVLLDDVPPLDSYKKHTIEVVVDRFKVRDDLQLRLAESFETVLKLGEGLAQISLMPEEAKPQKSGVKRHKSGNRQPKKEAISDIIFSSNFACPECNYSLGELEPLLFSFNNPVGACPIRDGLCLQSIF